MAKLQKIQRKAPEENFDLLGDHPQAGEPGGPPLAGGRGLDPPYGQEGWGHWTAGAKFLGSYIFSMLIFFWCLERPVLGDPGLNPNVWGEGIQLKSTTAGRPTSVRLHLKRKRNMISPHTTSMVFLLEEEHLGDVKNKFLV